MKLADVTDENWDHGFMINGDYLLIQRDPVKTYNNYELLRNRIVHTLTQEAVITNVSYEGEYVWLETSIHLEPREEENVRIEHDVQLLEE